MARSTSTVFDPAYRALAGSHRVQRVPDTEKRGRRHSSLVTVVFFDDDRTPVPVHLDKREVRIDTYRASGAGGQHRNKTDSAVRLTHLPTGIVVTATEERSQHQNRTVAWERLTAELDTRNRETAHRQVNAGRADTFDEFRTWTWTGWRDEVKGPGGVRSSMTKALAGRLDPLLR